MPEWRECYSHIVMALKLLHEYKSTTTFRLLKLWAELPSRDILDHPDLGLVEGKVSLVTWKWNQAGLTKNDSLMAPPQVSSPTARTVKSLGWTLKDISGNGRAMYLIFDSDVVLKFSYLLHTSIQFYPRDIWIRSVIATTGAQRGYKIAFALDFGKYVLAFVTNDFLFDLSWVTLIPDLDRPGSLTHPKLVSVDVYEDFWAFLTVVANWISSRRNGKARRTGLACEVMKDEQRVWVGLGVYTVCEVFFIAGVPMFLTEKEVFDNASRTARLVNAFWQFAHNGQDLYVSVIAPCMLKGLLAPTTEQRRLYFKYVYVFKKLRTLVATRMAAKIDKYKATLDILSERKTWWTRYSQRRVLTDPFEPSLMANALLLTTCHPKVDVASNHRFVPFKHSCTTTPCDRARKTVSLGPLIFGSNKRWQALAPPEVITLEKLEEERGQKDPLTSMFLLDLGKDAISCTYLDDDYNSIVPDDVSPNRRPWRVPYSYKVGQDSVWSILPDFPLNSAPDSNSLVPRDKAVSLKETNKVSTTMEHVIHTDGLVSIGPLEYCGNGIPLIHGVKKHVSVVKDGDPRLDNQLLVRSTRHRLATRATRHVQKMRVAKVKQQVKFKLAIARGKPSKAQVITIRKERVKGRALVAKEAQAKLQAILAIKKRQRRAERAKAMLGPTTLDRPVPSCTSARFAEVATLATDPEDSFPQSFSRTPSPSFSMDFFFSPSSPTPPTTPRSSKSSPEEQLSPPISQPASHDKDKDALPQPLPLKPKKRKCQDMNLILESQRILKDGDVSGSPGVSRRTRKARGSKRHKL